MTPRFRLLHAAVVAVGLVAAGPPAGAQVPMAIATGISRDMINAFRGAARLALLDDDPLLMALATQQALAMATARTMSHTVAGSLQQRLATGGYGLRTAAENIGYGQGSLDEVLDAWMRSPPHRANILDRRMTSFGVGAAVVDGVTYWALILAAPR
ncbi:MAG: CAP domain-containing protein [Bauldia sp.]|jgi:uncharacterized protein YkwD